MRRSERRLSGIAIGLTIGLALAGVEGAAGCSCGEVLTPLAGLEQADAVFEGRVTNIWPVFFEIDEFDVFGNSYTLTVTARWKGEIGRTVTLIDAYGNCSFPFRWGVSYTVFANQTNVRPSAWVATICGPTTDRLAYEDYKSLGRAEAFPVAGSVPPAESLAHIAARRIVLAFKGLESSANKYWHGSLDESVGGVLLKYGLGLFVALYAATGVYLAIRRRWRWFVLIVVLLPGAALLVGLCRSYVHIIHHPSSSYMAY